MKKCVFVIITVLLSIIGYGQNTTTRNRFLDGLDLAALGRQYVRQSPEIQGSPYAIKMFLPAKVLSVDKKAFMRYNAFNDEFEFINPKHDTLILNKEEEFNTVIFANLEYRLVNYVGKNDKMNLGYLIKVYEKKDYILFKKERTEFFKEKIAKSQFEISSPARFVRSSDVFYLKNGDKGISMFPSNKKGLLKLFPEKKTELEAFIKQNNIDFDKESDLIKTIDFLTT